MPDPYADYEMAQRAERLQSLTEDGPQVDREFMRQFQPPADYDQGEQGTFVAPQLSPTPDSTAQPVQEYTPRRPQQLTIENYQPSPQMQQALRQQAWEQEWNNASPEHRRGMEQLSLQSRLEEVRLNRQEQMREQRLRAALAELQPLVENGTYGPEIAADLAIQYRTGISALASRRAEAQRIHMALQDKAIKQQMDARAAQVERERVHLNNLAQGLPIPRQVDRETGAVFMELRSGEYTMVVPPQRQGQQGGQGSGGAGGASNRPVDLVALRRAAEAEVTRTHPQAVGQERQAAVDEQFGRLHQEVIEDRQRQAESNLPAERLDALQVVRDLLPQASEMTGTVDAREPGQHARVTGVTRRMANPQAANALSQMESILRSPNITPGQWRRVRDLLVQLPPEMQRQFGIDVPDAPAAQNATPEAQPGAGTPPQVEPVDVLEQEIARAQAARPYLNEPNTPGTGLLHRAPPNVRAWETHNARLVNLNEARAIMRRVQQNGGQISDNDYNRILQIVRYLPDAAGIAVRRAVGLPESGPIPTPRE